MPLPALGGKDFAVASQLVGGRNLGLLQVDIFDADAEPIPFFGAHPIVAVEEGLCANVREAVGQQAGLSVIAEDAIEGLDVGVDC